MTELNDAESLLRFGSAIGVPRSPVSGDLDARIKPDEGIPYIVCPNDYSIHDIEHLLPQPTRKRTNVVTNEAESFIFYTKKHGSLDECTIYAQIDSGDVNDCNLIAVIDDHGAEKAQWREHRCQFNPNKSVEWKRWLSNNKKPFSQSDFATWLEDNLSDIAGVNGMPSGADILAMSIGFEANSEKRLRSKINLQSGGVRFEFVEDEDKDTRTSMQVFERFTLGLPVFDGSTNAYPLVARLKYREKDGKVTFWYELIRPDRVFKTAVSEVISKIKDQTGFPIVFGEPG